MRVIKITRTISSEDKLGNRGSIRRLARDFFATENHLEFAVEALIFGALLAISVWPMVAAADAINRFL
jgi:hypothetical protein